jgi:DNA-binding transcriptional MerR regulator
VSDPTAPLLPIGAVVKRTGIPADTIRAWERRYGVPRPQRTASGRRLYSEADLEVIRQLRQRETGAAQLAASLGSRPARLEEDAALIAAAREADYATFVRRLNVLAALLPLEAWLTKVACPVISLLDELPAEAALLAGQLLRVRLIRLLGAFERDGAPVIVAGLAGSDLRVLAVGVVLARDGTPTLPLGEATPAALLARLAQRLDAPAILIEGAGAFDRLRASGGLVAAVGDTVPAWAVRLPDDPLAAAALVRQRIGAA